MKALVRDDAGRLLLIKRSAEAANFAGQWDLPGGKCDAGEAFVEALYREVREETGVTVEFVRFAGAGQFEIPGWIVIFLILETRLVGGDVRLSDEHTECCLAGMSEIEAMDVCEPYRETVVRFLGQTGTEGGRQ